MNVRDVTKVCVTAMLCVALKFSAAAAQGSMPGMQMGGISSMPKDPFGVSMDRMGSGTTWIPDAVPIPSLSTMAGSWMLVMHGYAFGQYNVQSGPRGDAQVGSLNWAMFMASRDLSGGRFQVRTMLSLDAATVTRKGYPLLLQSGESFDGEALHDMQHPHDFWMELGALYEREITKSVGVELYAAASGEPALGPVAFMHRPSATDNPFAPITHHWQDATHITFGVLTAGLFGNKWKIEASAFNGREPDDERWGFDELRLDSWSGRLTLNPTANWSMTAGYGYMASPEALHPDEAMKRFTASALYSRAVCSDMTIAATAVYGANKHDGHDASHSMLGETQVGIKRANTFLVRAEFVQKSAEDLVLPMDSHTRFNVSAISAGYIREIAQIGKATIGLGVLGTLNVVPSELASAYGSTTPRGGAVFLRLRPAVKPSGHDMDGMEMD